MPYARDEAASIINEVARRKKVAQFTPKSVLTDKERDFIEDESRFKLALCGRRAGKTTSCATVLLDKARTIPEANCAYVTGTRRMAKNIMWPILTKMNVEYNLGFKQNHTDLVMVHGKTGGRIQLSGANNVPEIEKLRGQPWDVVNIDEAQTLGRTLKSLINDVIAAALVDRDGSILLTGTPGPVPAGPFFDAWSQGMAGKGWSVHGWTMDDNPHVLRGRKFIDIVTEEAERRGVDVSDPSIQREFYGRWMQDTDALVINLTEDNYFTGNPHVDAHVLGGDLGYDDADAIADLGWPWIAERPVTYLLEEHVEREVSALDFIERAIALNSRIMPMAFALDTAGIGKKLAKACEDRGLPVTAFDKSEKTARAMILRSAVMRKELKVRKDGPFDQDCKVLCWEYDAYGRKKISDKGINDKAYHSDIFDAVLGAYLESMGHRAVKPKPKPTVEQKMREERRAARKKKAEPDDLFAGKNSEQILDNLFADDDDDGSGLW